jgi:methyl-accepting chemotaxis protein
MFPNFQLRTQLLVFAGVLCALLLAVGVTGLLGTRITHGHFVDAQTDLSLADKVAAINYKVFDSRLHIAQAQNSVDKEQMQKEGATVAANIQALNLLLKELAEVPVASTQSGAVGQFEQVVNNFTQAYLVPAVKAMEAGQAEELHRLVATQADRFYQPIKQGREQIQQVQKATAQAHKEQTAASYRFTFSAVLLLSAAGLLISIFYGRQSVTSITRKTAHLRDTLQHIATRHDLTVQAALAGKDELAEIASHLNILLASLSAVMTSATGHSQHAETAGNRLVQQADEAQCAIEQQNQALAAGSQALAQVAEQTHRIGDNMREAAQLVDDGEAKGAHGAELVNRVAHTMGDIAAKVGDAGVKIEQLGEQSAKVDGIAITIQEIAGQTNLLALNAAIEAARAGESGRGFAVVADEVRKLAERTQQATSEIQRTLQAIRVETSTATESMVLSRQQINAGIVQAQEAAAAINGIRELIVTVNQRIKEIDAAIQNQVTASESVSTRMQESAALSRQSAELSQSTRDTAHQVVDVGQKLRDAVATFRV